MLKVFIDNTDISYSMENYQEDEYSFVLLASGEIMIGYYKPINALYVELKTPNINAATMSFYYYNGTSYLTAPFRDDTKGLTRSGFIKWDRNLDKEASKLEHGETLYWYKLKLSVDSSATIAKGINLVFSNDNDLKEEYPTIMDMLPENDASFIRFHTASRKDIVSYFKGQGKYILNNGKKKNLDQFDLLEFEEVRDASKFLTLAKILHWQSDAVDDKWYQKAKMYESKYGEKLSAVNLSVDENDDGKQSNSEINAIQSISIVRQ